MNGQSKRVKLREIAFARSGDKGSNSNIGLFAYTPEGYQYLRQVLKPETVARHFQALKPTEVKRYELPLLNAFNFVLVGALGEGGSRSLRVDAQGKALGIALLELEVEIPATLWAKCLREKRESRDE
ncbi:MAG TPA: hypothetical protein PLP42_21110 [Acidobacteriota bacterium]|nr:hypothetical protein [Acidobacteriota bacterium]